jgi:hypothetical protein
MNKIITSIEDTKKVKFNIRNNIFREYYKVGDEYCAINKFYVSEDIDDKIVFRTFESNVLNESNEKIIPFSENVYISTNSNFEKYIDLIVISNISFSLEDININKSEIIKKIMENDVVIDEKLFEDLYFNEEFSNKIDIQLPKKYNNKKIILEDIDICKKYLFKINILELSRSFYQENNLLSYSI